MQEDDEQTDPVMSLLHAWSHIINTTTTPTDPASQVDDANTQKKAREIIQSLLDKIAAERQSSFEWMIIYLGEGE